MNTNKKALLAVAMVALMLAVPFTIISDSEQTDATSYWPTNPSYTYTVDFTNESNIIVKSGSNVMISPLDTGTEADVTTLNNLGSHDDTVYKLTEAGTLMPGNLSVAVNNLVKFSIKDNAWVKCTAWTWNSSGVGPFGAFYAAISLGIEDEQALSTTPGHVAYILDPMNLTHAIKYMNGSTITTGDLEISSKLTDYNVMLVIPTVYWSVQDKVVTLSNAARTGAVAYAHQADGYIYPYLAIGVYEATADDNYGLLSKTGVKPTTDKNLPTFRTYVDTANQLLTDNVGTYQMWNLYEWSLYKLMAEAYISSVDSSAKAGGLIGGTTSATAGEGNGGPQSASGTGSYGKILIENAWGSVWEFIDNTVVKGGVLKAGSGLTNELSDTNVKVSGQDYTGGQIAIGSGTLGQNIAEYSLSAASFGVPLKADNGSAVIPDGFWFNSSGNRALIIGGGWAESALAGLSAWGSHVYPSAANYYFGARLAYLMSADAADTTTIANRVVKFVESDYTSSQSVSPGSSVTLFRAEDSSEGVFAGWYTDAARTVSAGTINSPYTPAGNVTLYAKYDPVATLAFYEWNGNAYSDTAGQSYSGLVSGDSVMIPGANSPTVTANNITYEFVGWYKAGTVPTTEILTTGQTNYANTLYDVGELTAATAVNMYAVYAPVSETVAITFKTVATDTGFSVDYVKDSYVQLPVLPDNETGRFVGWSATEQTEGGDVQTLVSQTGYQATAATTLFAQYAALTGKVTATFYDASGNAIASSTIAPGFTTDANGQIKYNEGQVIGLPAFSAVSGTIFVGWYTAATGGSLIGVPGDVFALTANTSFYARTATNVSIAFQDEAGTPIAGEAITAYAGQVITLPNYVAADDGYVLKGWYDARDAEGHEIILGTYGSKYTVTEDITFKPLTMQLSSGGNVSTLTLAQAANLYTQSGEEWVVSDIPVADNFAVTAPTQILPGTHGLITISPITATYSVSDILVVASAADEDAGIEAGQVVGVAIQLDSKRWMIQSVTANAEIRICVQEAGQALYGFKEFYINGLTSTTENETTILNTGASVRIIGDSYGLAAGTVSINGTYVGYENGNKVYGYFTANVGNVAVGDEEFTGSATIDADNVDNPQIYCVYAKYTADGSSAVVTPTVLGPRSV